MGKVIKIKDETYNELYRLLKYGETMGDIVARCLDAYKRQ